MKKVGSILKQIQKVNMLIFGIIGLQMLVVPLITGWLLIDYYPLAGISFAILFLSYLSSHYFHHPFARTVAFILDFICMGLFTYWGFIFSGPFDIILQIVLLTLIFINISGMVLNIVLFGHGIKVRSFHLTLSDEDERITKLPQLRKKGLILTGFLVASIFFAGLATINFGITYNVRAPDSFITRSSYWGPPSFNKTLVTSPITPINNNELLISNSSLGTNYQNLRPGALMYVDYVHHSSTPGVNYCNYSQGAQSYPNGTVFLSQALPSLLNVEISFYYMLNVKAMEYLSQGESRIIHAFWGRNRTWYESADLFAAMDVTHEYLMMEYWNISYYINVQLNEYPFPHLFNYNSYSDLGTDVLDWIALANPALDHCLGISYDFEKDDRVSETLNPDRQDMGENPFSWLVGDKGWYEYNEQNPEILNLAKDAYFSVYDLAESYGFGVYVVYQYSAIEDIAEGDIDWTRLPVWKHPACEYGMMSYQSGLPDDEASWDIYKTTHNQMAVYGNQGETILTGWLDTNETYLKYYTNDLAGLNRYIRDIKIHQACGIKEIFHAPLFKLQEKWGDEAILQMHEALNSDPKEAYTFQAEPWGSFDTILNDIVENYNKVWIAIPVLIFSGLLLLNSSSTLSKKLMLISKSKS